MTAEYDRPVFVLDRKPVCIGTTIIFWGTITNHRIIEFTKCEIQKWKYYTGFFRCQFLFHFGTWRSVSSIGTGRRLLFSKKLYHEKIWVIFFFVWSNIHMRNCCKWSLSKRCYSPMAFVKLVIEIFHASHNKQECFLRRENWSSTSWKFSVSSTNETIPTNRET